MQEIMSIVSSLSSDRALQLLRRAESFVQPCLGDRGMQAKLMKLLQMRASLPPALRGDAIKELIDILPTQPEDSEDNAVMSLLANFKAWDVAPRLASCSTEGIACLQAAARKSRLLPCREVLDAERACRLAAESLTAAGAKALWQFVLELSSAAEPGIWLRAASLVLAALQCKVEADLSIIPDTLLANAVSWLKAPLDAAALATEVFNCDLGVTADAGERTRSLALLLLEQARRCAADSSEQERLLTEAFAADEENYDVQGQLLKLLLQRLEDSKLDKEDVLLKLLFLEHDDVPEELLPKLLAGG